MEPKKSKDCIQVKRNSSFLQQCDLSKMSECRVLLTRCDNSAFPGTKSKDFNCQLCQKKYVSKLYLQTHIQRVHEKHRDHKCSFCSYESFTKGQLQRHSTTHTKEKTNICSICGLRTPTFENIYSHQLTHFQSKYYSISITKKEYLKSGRKLIPNFSCKSCDEKFPDFQSISDHITPFVQCLKCNNCGSVFASKNDRLDHKNEITEDLECKFCYQLFNSSCDHLKHETSHLGDFLKTKQCPVCSVSLSNVPALKKHIQMKHLSTENAVKNRCTECKMIFKSEMLLSLHTQVYHDSSQLGSDSHGSNKCHICGVDLRPKPGTGKKASDSMRYARHVVKKHAKFGKVQYGCILCNKEFRNGDPHLPGHIAMHFLIDISEVRVPCRVCDKEFTSEGSRNRHSQTCHRKRPLVNCKICGKNVQEAFWSNHTRRHLNERSYTCEECGKNWVTSGDLKKHLKSHSKVKKYPCQFCGKSFGICENRRRHEKTVHSETRVSCKVCSKTFSHWNYLKDHLVIHNENKEFKCKFCGKGYQSRPNMYRHIRETHPSNEK